MAKKKSSGLRRATIKTGKAESRSVKIGRSVFTGKSATQTVGKVDQQVSASALHRDTRLTLDLLQSSDAVAVTHYNEVEGYLVAPDAFVDLVERAEEADARENELASTVTLLLAAARTGVPVPSNMLERVMPNVDVAERWREIAEFAATFPIRLTAGEHGEPITRARLAHVPGYIEESGSDDDLDLG